MPTFQSIGVHPALRLRLVTQSSVIAAASTKEASGNEDLAHSRSDVDAAQHSAAATPHYSAVETPLALLACHPDSLRLLDPATGKCHALAGDQVTSLRQEVAHAMFSGTFDGRHVDRVRRALRSQAAKEGGGASFINGRGSEGPSSKRKRRLSPSNAENVNPPSNAIDSSDRVDVCAGDEATATTAPSSSKDHQLVGTLTSLDLIRYESLLLGKNSDVPGRPLTTGSMGLDELLSFPVEYGGMLGLSTGCSGVPRGYVTQLYGPSASGKTQVALHVVAHRLGEQRSGLASHDPAPLFAPEKRRRTHYPCWVLVPPGRQVLCAERIAELCGNDSAVMGQTYVLPVSDIYQVLSALAVVEEALSSDALGPSEDAAHHGVVPGSTPPSLIVFDGASTCCCFSDPTSEEAMRLLHHLAKTLKRISRHHLAAVLVTNGSVMATPQSTSCSGSGAADVMTKRMVPALGRIWERAVDIQVQLECALPSPNETPSTDVRKATLMRHPTKAATCSTGSTRAAHFSIHKSFGVRDAHGSGGK